MSNKKEREKRREEREAAEVKVSTADRRTRLLQIGAGAVFLAIVVVVVLIVVNGSSSSGGDSSNIVEVSEVEQLLGNIPQQGLTLGETKAPVELMEYGDLQCPICKEYSEEILPPIIEGQVKQGQARISFHNFVIISEESKPAGAAALAAGEQGLGWNYIETFYRNQGEERSGYVTDEFMESVAKAVGVKDLAKWNEERKSSKLLAEVEKSTEQANTFGFSGTPSFAIKGPGTKGIELLGTPETTGDIEEDINKAAG